MPTAAPPDSAVHPRSHQPLVYVLDDDVRVCAAISRVLSNAGFRCREFVRVPELEMALSVLQPDIILLDLSLGESDAIETMRRLAAAHYRGAVLLISGRHDARVIDEVEKIGQRHGIHTLPFLQKPFRFDELKSRLMTLTQKVGADASLVEQALQNNWLELWYQPKINMRSRMVCGAEALIRLRHPERGVLSPLEFLPPPADPLHKPLADFVIRHALVDQAIFIGDGLETRLSINVPLSVFETPDFVSNLRRYLLTNPKLQGLTIELTEGEVSHDHQFAREVAVQLKLYGIDIAIDDFGTRHSTLQRLLDLPFAELKIDRKYVGGCASAEDKRLLCQSVILLAHRLNMTVTAEGVESAADAQALADMGCDTAQGFLFARPLPAADFKCALLANMSKTDAAKAARWAGHSGAA